MSLGEFEVIERYFTRSHRRKDVLLGVGDDAAVMKLPAGARLVAAVDTINEGIHFLPEAAAADVGYRALAVNLSDVAAMGAEPRWFTLSLSLPAVEPRWLEGFSAGLFELAEEHHLELVGGDTVKGPLSISLQLLGSVEADKWLTRSGGQVGDTVFVSGVPGEAAAGLHLLQDRDPRLATVAAKHLLQRFLRPEPRVALGRAARSIANAAMDVSDGLLTDLSKLCKASACGARLDLECLPRSPAMQSLFDADRCERWALGGGDDYELLLTVPHERLLEFEACFAATTSCVPIGRLIPGAGVQCYRGGEVVAIEAAGFDHFGSVS